MTVLVVTERQVAELADHAGLIAAMDEVFLACARKQADNYPLVRTQLRGTQDLFGIKSGCNYATGDLGLKCGGYWNGNAARSIDRHQSTILLLDAATGQARALVAGNNLTALRTAAAAASAARRLARTDAAHVGMLGTGRQALFQLEALRAIRPIRSVSAWSRSPAHVEAFGEAVRRLGLDFAAAATSHAAARDADIIVTVTPSREPLLRLADIPPGAHVNAMGSDTQGKRELAGDLLDAARIWADDLQQARAIGECQYLSGQARVAEIGDLLLDGADFERAEGEITVFDGTGLALQDLAAARLVIAAALQRGTAQAISF